MNSFNKLYKILIIGNSGVGKSCILLQYSDRIYSESFISTIGVDFKIKTIKSGDDIIKLQIWDTAGQEKYRTITSSYYKGAHGVVIVYDITKRASFESIDSWLTEIRKYATMEVASILVGNKCDMESTRAVMRDEGQQVANALGINFFEISAKSNVDVTNIFTVLISEIKRIDDDSIITLDLEKPKNKRIKLNSDDDTANCDC